MLIYEAEELIGKIKRFYVYEIKKAAESHGGLESLSVHLGYSPKYLYRALERGSFSALRRIVKKILNY